MKVFNKILILFLFLTIEHAQLAQTSTTSTLLKVAKISKIEASPLKNSDYKPEKPIIQQPLKLKTKNFSKKPENEQKNIEKPKEKENPLFYLSWLIFVPVVLLILVMTLLSIGGFFILLLNMNQDKEKNDAKALLEAAYKIKIQSKKNNSGKQEKYKSEPEPEIFYINI